MPPVEPSDSPAPHREPAVTAAIARLSSEFAGSVRKTTIRRVVIRSRSDLSGIPAPALPELVERLARQRLLQVADAKANS